MCSDPGEGEAQNNRFASRGHFSRTFDAGFGLQGLSDYLRDANIRAYVAAVQAIVTNETASISAEKMAGWSEWALAQSDPSIP
jgi:hypothetical protein